MESELPHVILNISSPLDIAMSGHAERIGDPERGDSLPLFEEFSPIRRVLAAQKMKLGEWVVCDTREIFRPWEQSLCGRSLSARAQKERRDFDDGVNALWSLYDKEAQTHDEAQFQSLSADMEGVPTFAGLFAAVLTSFFVDSLQNLQPDPAQQAVYYHQQSVAILAQISQKIAFIYHPTGSNPIYSPTTYPTFHPSSVCGAFSTSRSTMGSVIYAGARSMRAMAVAVPSLIRVSHVLFFFGLCDYLLDFNTFIGVITIVLRCCSGSFFLYGMLVRSGTAIATPDAFFAVNILLYAEAPAALFWQSYVSHRLPTAGFWRNKPALFDIHRTPNVPFTHGDLAETEQQSAAGARWDLPSLLQGAIDNATHRLTRRLPGISFSELKRSGRLLISEISNFPCIYSTPITPQLASPTQQIRALSALSTKLRDVPEGQSIEDDGEVLESLKSIDKVRFPLRQACCIDDTPLWRLQDLRDSGGLGFTELFFLSLRQLLSVSSSQESNHVFTGIFRSIVSR
ncbi:hypothetical protein V8E53_006299 [Lactarius tabidus]